MRAELHPSTGYALWARAVASVLGARSFAAAAAFLCNVLVARQLGDAHFSQFYLLFSIMTVVAGVTGPAVDTSLVRFAVKYINEGDDRSAPYFKAVFYLKLVMLAATALVCLAATRPLLQTLFVYHADAPYNVRYYYILLAFAGGAIVSMWGFAQAYFQAHQRFAHYAGYEFFSSLLRLGLVVVLMGGAVTQLLPYLGAYVVAPLAMCIISWTQLPWAIFRAQTNWGVVRQLWDFGKWVLATTVFTTIVQRLDIILLNLEMFAVPKSTVGRYSAAVSMVLAGELVLLTFFSVLLPKASALKSAEDLRRFIGQFRIPSLLFGLVLCASVVVSGPFVRIVLGAEYEGTQYYFTILILGVTASIVCAPAVTAAYSLGHSSITAYAEGARLVATLLLGLYVIPAHGAWGMAVVVSVTRAMSAGTAYIYSHQLVKRQMFDEYRSEPPPAPHVGE